MSTNNLKFWPDKLISENKCALIAEALIALKCIEPLNLGCEDGAYKAGPDIEKYLPGFTYLSTKKDVSIHLHKNHFGINQCSQDIKSPKRYNVLEFDNVDGSLDDWELMLQTLENITGDDYEAG